MATAADVSNYIDSRTHVWGDIQRQKLVYYAQAWSLAWDGVPLFSEHVEAWQLGPVVPDLWRQVSQPSREGLTAEQMATIDAVLAFYGPMTGAQLSTRTHDEAPWRDAWGDRHPGDRCSEEITPDAMRRFYTAEAIAGRAPARRNVTIHDADDEDVAERAHANAHRWRRALDLLSR